MLEVNLPLGTMRIFTAVVPVSATHSISKWTMMRDFFTGKWADRDSRRRTDKIFLEDQPTVEGQRPELVPFDLSAELHIKSDANQIAYRRWRQAAMDRGWGFPDYEPGDRSRNAVRVVASPARREDPDLANAWVLKELESEVALRDPRSFDQGGIR
jgi:Vanillate O-demethylase oxygenase C-terminal domain